MYLENIPIWLNLDETGTNTELRKTIIQLLE